MKILIATIVSALALSGAGVNLGVHSFASGEQRPAMEVCVAGMQMAFGGAAPVSLSMSQSGRCGCPDSCSIALLRVAGFTLRL